MNQDRDLIEEIVSKLKSQADFPYKEGAWESFKKIEENNAVKNNTLSIKYIAAAVLLFFGAAFSLYLFNDNSDISIKNNNIDQVVGSGNAFPQSSDESQSIDFSNKLENKTNIEDESILAQESKKVIVNNILIESKNLDYSLQGVALNNLSTFNSSPLPAKVYVGKILISNLNNINQTKPLSSTSLTDQLVLANRNLAKNMLSKNILNSNLTPKSFRFGDKFDLGLFISPFSTRDNFNLGAGVSIAYNINSKISIRTGASYNNYEVAILKNPFAETSVETVKVDVANSLGQKDGAQNFVTTQTITLPNISAVTGYVKSLDIPLEVKYNISKGLYTVVGASYSTILNQERNAQYIENINSDKSPESIFEAKEMQTKQLSPVTKIIKSSEDNVKSSGYSGFINLSVGKKVKVNKKFGVSVEPYYKIPLGEFKRSEMNYSNGGVRIITNF